MTERPWPLLFWKMAIIKLPNSTLDLSGPCLIMAIVNCNGDSFYPSSRALGRDAADKALAAEQEGASIIDFGAESSRPGSSYIDAEEEISRVIPVIEAFRQKSVLPVSIDTRKAKVARLALEAGADIINDISALEDDKDMAPLAAKTGAAVILVHKKGDPQTMQISPVYDDVLAEVGAYLKSAANRALAAGIGRDRIILDPGFGFGKNTEDNLVLLACLAEIRRSGYPLLVGLSHKSFVKEILGRDSAEDLAGTLAASAAAVMAGADIIRVHETREHADLVKVLDALAGAKKRQGRQ